jgi:hypothetical protein
VLAGPQAAWRSGKAPAEGARAVGEWREDTWAREKLEVEGGGQERRIAPAAGEPDEQRRRAEEQGLREEEGGRMEPRTILQNQRNTRTSL